jgi:UDP-N-acetylmuramoylalanine--D-glutamate ligase
MQAATTQTMTDKDRQAELLQRRILIVGLGATGLSCARFLAAQGARDLAVTDSRDQPPGLPELQTELPDVAVFSGGFEPAAFARAELLVVSPGVSVQSPLIVEARARGAEIIGDIELFARFATAPVLAITGSNGKSTVTCLLAAMAQHSGVKTALGGNIGTPALDLLDPQVELYVLELSSFQLETTSSLAPEAAALLNISEDHMDRYASLADYTAAKTRIYHGSGTLVVNRDDPRVRATLDLIPRGRPVIGFGLDTQAGPDFGLCQRDGVSWLCRGSEPLLPVTELKITGRHNLANALAALALGHAAGLRLPAMLDALREFPGLPHRCQWVAERAGVTFINDSKATNVGAALAAIDGLEADRLVLIAGGQGKGQDFRPLRTAIAVRCRAVILIGEDADQLAAALDGSAPLCRATSLADAVQLAAALAQPGEAVLLSPACASFDMFEGFAARGEAFIQAVEGLA